MSDTASNLINVTESKPEPTQVDYFGTVNETERHTLPDGKSYVEVKVMTEGDRRKYLANSNKGIRIEKSGDSLMEIDPGGNRFHLLMVAIVDWNLTRAGADVRFNTHELRKFLENAPPSVIDGIELAVNELNPWLSDNITVEGIDEEIERLTELREKTVARDEGKES